MVDLSDAKALLARAQLHYRDFNEAVHGRGLSSLWKITKSFDPRSAEWCHTVSIDQKRLVAAKPILTDAATNTISSLDHIVGALSRFRSTKRQKLYFPRVGDQNFAGDLKHITKHIGDEMAQVVKAAHHMHQQNAPHLQAARKIANSGKHWELPLSEGSIRGIALNLPGPRQRIFDIPADAFSERDTYEYYRGDVALPNVSMYIIFSSRITGLPETLPASPDSIFECSFRYVQGMIEAVARAAAGGISVKRHATIQLGSRVWKG